MEKQFTKQAIKYLLIENSRDYNYSIVNSKELGKLNLVEKR